MKRSGLRRDRRARITVPDVLYVLVAFAFIGALYPVFWDGFSARVGELHTGAAYLFQLVLPFGVLVLFSIVYVKATSGGAP